MQHLCVVLYIPHLHAFSKRQERVRYRRPPCSNRGSCPTAPRTNAANLAAASTWTAALTVIFGDHLRDVVLLLAIARASSLPNPGGPSLPPRHGSCPEAGT